MKSEIKSEHVSLMRVSKRKNTSWDTERRKVWVFLFQLACSIHTCSCTHAYKHTRAYLSAKTHSTCNIHTSKGTNTLLPLSVLKGICVLDQRDEGPFGCNRKSLFAAGELISLFPLEAPGQICICSPWNQRKRSTQLLVRTQILQGTQAGMSWKVAAWWIR